MSNPNTGVTKVAPKELTKPQTFDLETDRRNTAWEAHKAREGDNTYEFHAKPLPKGIFKDPMVSILSSSEKDKMLPETSF